MKNEMSMTTRQNLYIHCVKRPVGFLGALVGAVAFVFGDYGGAAFCEYEWGEGDFVILCE